MAITRMVPKQYEMVDGKYTMVRDQYLETIAVGATLKVGTGTIQIMSDIWGTEKYALYWNEAEQKPERVTYNVEDMGWQYGSEVHAEVDATPEVKAAYREYLIAREVERRVRIEEERNVVISKGCIAKVTRGKTAVGTEGKVIAVIKARYGMGYYSSMENKIGIATSDVTYKKALPNGKVVDAHKDVVWVWARNCVRVDVPAVDLEAVRADAEAMFIREAA